MGVNPTGGGATLRESLPIGRRYSRFVRVVFQERTGHGQAARFRKARAGGAGRLRLDHHGGRGTDRAGARRRGIATVLPKHEQAGLAGRARAGTADAPSERTGGRTGRSSCGGLPDPGRDAGGEPRGRVRGLRSAVPRRYRPDPLAPPPGPAAARAPGAAGAGAGAMDQLDPWRAPPRVRGGLPLAHGRGRGGAARQRLPRWTALGRPPEPIRGLRAGRARPQQAAK